MKAGWRSILVLAVLSLVMAGAVPLRAGQSAALKQAQGLIKAKQYRKASHALTRAMNSGQVEDGEMARALYLRGLAFEAMGRKAAAIADLTGALDLGRLSASEKKAAHAARARAYAATGFAKMAARDRSLAVSGFVSKVKPARWASRASRPVRSARAAAAAASTRHKSAIPAFATIVKPVSAQSAHSAPRKYRARPARRHQAKKPIPAFRTSVSSN